MSHEKALETAKLAQYDLVRDRNAYPKGPMAEGRSIYRVIGWEGADRGGLLLSEAEADAVRESLRSAPLSALVPDEVAGVVERLRKQIDHVVMGVSARKVFIGDDVLELCRGADAIISTITALAARAEKAEREAEAWERRAGEAIMGEAAAVERITTLEAEIAALRARLEEADLDMDWVTTAHVFCDRLGIERKADAEHIASAIALLRAKEARAEE